MYRIDKISVSRSLIRLYKRFDQKQVLECFKQQAQVEYTKKILRRFGYRQILIACYCSYNQEYDATTVDVKIFDLENHDRHVCKHATIISPYDANADKEQAMTYEPSDKDPRRVTFLLNNRVVYNDNPRSTICGAYYFVPL